MALFADVCYTKLFEDYGYNAEVLDYVREDEEYHNVTELLLKNPKMESEYFY